MTLGNKLASLLIYNKNNTEVILEWVAEAGSVLP